MFLIRLRIELPLPVYFHAVTVSGEGKMVMFGGVDSIEQNTRTNKVLLPFSVQFFLSMFHQTGVHSLADRAKSEGDGLGSRLSLHPTHCQAPKG